MRKYSSKYKEFIDLLNFSNGKYEKIDVFKDFVTIYAIAIKNKMYFKQEDENIYFDIIKKYKKSELDIFPKLVNALIELYYRERDEIRDVLGEIYYEIGAIKGNRKQFFSPKEIGKLNSLLAVGKKITKKEFITIYDPTCGSGVLLLEAANELMRKKIAYTQKAYYGGQDVDFICFCMAYIQPSLYGMPAIIILGDTLTLQEKKVFYTPEFFIGKWDEKLKNKK